MQTRLLPTKKLTIIMAELSVDSLLDFEEATDRQEVTIQKRDESSALVESTIQPRSSTVLKCESSTRCWPVLAR